MANNPAIGFKIEKKDLSYAGKGLSRPECIIAQPDGTLLVSDANGVMRINADGSQHLIRRKSNYDKNYEGKEPATNGFALMPNGNMLIANFGTDVIEEMSPDGTCRLVMDKFNGKRLGSTNFILRDPKEGYWASISTYEPDSFAAHNGNWGPNDGFVMRVDSKGPRIVAEGIRFTNECRLDAKGQFLYVVESFGCCIARFPIKADGNCGPKELFGPADLGGIPDGIAFDEAGNLWVTLIGVDQLGFITPQGDLHIVLELGLPDRVQSFRAAFNERRVGFNDLLTVSDDNVRVLTSITFGGADRKAVFLGSIMGESLPSFRSPVAGLPLAHWK